MEVSYKVIEKKNLPQLESDLVNFYNRYFPEESNRLAVKNSSVFFVALKRNEIIGVCRIITDFSRYALLLDLIVRKAERGKGIGKKLVKLTSSYCKDKKIKHLILTTDPRLVWLKDFYAKLGFDIVKNQSLMEFSG